MSRCRSPSRSPSTNAPDVDADEMSNSHRSPLLIPATLAVGSSTYVFVASHWLEQSSSRFSCSHFARIQSSRSQASQVLKTTFYVVLSPLLTEACFKKPLYILRPPLIGPRPWCHTPRLIVMHVVSDLFSKYSDTPLSKHASGCSAIRLNYQSQPQLMSFTYIGP